MQTEFTNRDVCRLTGLTRRQVLCCTERGIVEPDFEKTTGSGVHRRYSIYNVMEFSILKEFSGYGFHISAARRMLDAIRIQTFEFYIRHPAKPVFFSLAIPRDTIICFTSLSRSIVTNCPDFHKQNSIFCLDIGKIAHDLLSNISSRAE